MGAQAPFVNAKSIVATSNVDFKTLTGKCTKQILVGTGGNLVVTMASQTANTANTVTLKVPTGAILDIAVSHIWSSGTANDLVGFY